MENVRQNLGMKRRLKDRQNLGMKRRLKDEFFFHGGIWRKMKIPKYPLDKLR